MNELNYVRDGCHSDIRFEGIQKLCEFLSIIAKINMAVKDGAKSDFVKWITFEKANIEDVYDSNIDEYMREMRRENGILNHGDVQEIIDKVNLSQQSNFAQIQAVHEVNEAIEKCDVPRLKQALMSIESVKNELTGMNEEEDYVHLMCLMRDFKANLSLAENEDRQLWMDHIGFLVKEALEHNEEARRAGTALAIVNMAVLQGDAAHTYQTMLHDDLHLNETLLEESSAKRRYQQELSSLLLSFKPKDNKSSWITHT